MNDNNDQLGLFSSSKSENAFNSPELHDKNAPLAFRARPLVIDELKGHDYLFKKYPFLSGDNFTSFIVFGPPGTGKTTLAQILSFKSSKHLFKFNAVLGGVNDLRKLIQEAADLKQLENKDSIIFIDEIHRFNKAQQDALLPYIEAGNFTLIGATTENPRRSINRALLSRLQTVELKELENQALKDILIQAASKFDINYSKEIIDFIANYSSGDARKALNLLELVEKNPTSSLKDLKPLIVENSRHFDKTGDRHYDIISAFIKSIRGSDPDAALLWLAVMLDGGEDPVFIGRRLVISASEDIGNADINALPLAVAGLQTVQLIGMPEARITLAQVTTYLASTVKSNAAYTGINDALVHVQSLQSIDTPNHLKNRPLEGKGQYIYPHDYPESFVNQQYSPEGTPNFYRPKEVGHEAKIRQRLNLLWKK